MAPFAVVGKRGAGKENDGKIVPQNIHKVKITKNIKFLQKKTEKKWQTHTRP